MQEKENEIDRKDFMTYAKESIGLAPLEIKIKRLSDGAKIPFYAHDGDVGMDLTAISIEYDPMNDVYIYHTGLALESEQHYGVLLFPRSSNRKTEAYLVNHVGIVDSTIYRGEIMLCFKNRTSLRQIALEAKMIEFFDCIERGLSIEHAVAESTKAWSQVMNCPMQYAPYKVGDRVAQMVAINYPNVKLTEVGELSSTERGEGGFGSTGN